VGENTHDSIYIYNKNHHANKFAWTCWYKQLSRFTSYNLSVTEMNQTSYIDELKMELAKDYLAKQCTRAKSNYKECQKKRETREKQSKGNKRQQIIDLGKHKCNKILKHVCVHRRSLPK